jgi:hypothetical protein
MAATPQLGFKRRAPIVGEMDAPSKPYNRRDRLRRGALTAALAVAVAGCADTAPPPPVKAPAPPEAPRLQRYTGAGFSIDTPLAYAVDTGYDYEAFGPGKDIHGVSFTIPAALATGTNLSPDSYLAVETLPGLSACTAAPFVSDGDVLAPVTENGVAFSVAHATQGAAGNFYEETVYAATGTRPCIAVRYFIHSTNIANYDPGTIKAFDKAALLAQFDVIRKSLRLAPAQ